MRSELVHQELATLFLSAIHLRKSIKSILNASLRTLNLGSCGVCGYSFCVLCFRAYHGVDDCKFKSGKKVWIARYKLRGQVFFLLQLISNVSSKSGIRLTRTVALRWLSGLEE